jgi:Cysteine-rich secretory protein family
MNKDESASLAVHNTARAQKGLHPLQWDQGLAHAATQYAQHLAQIGKLEHSSGTGQGENLFWASPANNSALQNGAKAWLNEAGNYHGEVIPQGNFASYGHYSKLILEIEKRQMLTLREAQAMWRSTTHVGIGQARDSKGGVYVVGRYTPQGNIVGQKPY